VKNKKLKSQKISPTELSLHSICLQMSSNEKNLSVRGKSATRASASPQLAAGVGLPFADNQGRVQSVTGAEFGYQARTGEMDLAENSQSGISSGKCCPGCGNKPGNGTRYTLEGDGKESLRQFVQVKRQSYLERRGTSPDSADVSLEQLYICTTCLRDFYRQRAESSENVQIDSQTSNTINLDIPRVACNKQKCVFAHHHSQLKVIPSPTRRKVLIDYRLYIPPDARICAEHLRDGEWERLLDSNIRTYSPTQIQEMVDILRDTSKRPPFLDFEHIEEMEERQVKEWTGLSIGQFSDLYSSVPSLKKEKRHSKTALGIWLAKSRTGESDERISTLVNLSRPTTEHLMEKARHFLADEWVPRHLGIPRITRDFLRAHMTTVATGLFCAQDVDKCAVVMDGTYIYIQKSSNYRFQRRCYSGHKHRPLLKPFVIVAPDGHIIDIIGPYEANINDATISKQIGSHLRSFLGEGDVVLVDRGFRDAVQHLTALGLDVRMPEINTSGQLTTAQVNRTKLVTKCRWVVEARNGHLKQCFRLFDKVWPNQSLPHMMIDLRIAAAILNAYHPNIQSDVGDGDMIAEQMLLRSDKGNSLAEMVQTLGLNRKSAQFQSIDGNDLQFPELTEADLRFLTLGGYQLRLAPSYYAEHIKMNGRYEIGVCKHVGPLSLTSHGISAGDPMLIRGRIQSRHRNSTRYFIYILIDREKVGVDSVFGCCCSCPVGLGTVGCCAHITTVLWYLGFAQHLAEIPIPADFLEDICVELEGQE
jgi:hypothetical protein